MLSRETKLRNSVLDYGPYNISLSVRGSFNVDMQGVFGARGKSTTALFL